MANTLFKPGSSSTGLSNPMTTAGDIIYGDVGGTALRLGAGTAGQVLGAGAAPSWVNPINGQNFLVNGAFDYWQVGTSATVTATGGGTPTNSYLYQADQWYARNILGGGTIEGVITYSQATASSNGSLYGAKLLITTAPTGTGIQNGCELWQTLSNKASLPLYGQTASFSVQVKAFGNVTQVGVQFFYATTEVKANSANSIGSEILTTVNSASFTACTISGQALGTSQTTSGVIGVRIRITGVSSGNTYDLNNGFVAEQAILNLGSAAAPFQRQFSDPAQELMACQYFYRLVTAGLNGGGGSTTSVQVTAYISPMRATPSVGTPTAAVQVTDFVNANSTQSSPSASLAEGTSSSVRIILGNFTGITANRPYAISSSGGVIPLDARL